MKILLTSVFGPYGVDDEYGRKENLMELFHNQVTREQGVFSLRFHHPSFGLYFLAENISAPTTVLDFPSEERFVRELAKGYDYVGISFIVPNFIKAKRMAELVRRHAPASQIVLGGHGTRIAGLEEMIEHDHICRGEGVRFLRRLLGEEVKRPFVHPIQPSTTSKRIVGIPLANDAAVLIPGVGCPNACRFCATSHFFDTTYTPFFDSGKELFDICRRIEAASGTEEFFVMDENFLKRPERARELMRLMEEHDALYRFGIFSSAETVAEVGVDFLARLGVYFLWIGVESKREVYTKNRGIDLRAMIRDLRSHGISVLASGILFLEHHDHQTLWEDVDHLIGLEPDLCQFMQLGPMPGTALYRDYDSQGILRKDIPFEEWHGQHRLWFDHPRFTAEESEQILREAFRRDRDTLGSSLLRMCDTTIRGYATLARYPDPVMARRRGQLRERAVWYRQSLLALRRFAYTPHVRTLTEQIEARFESELGPMPLTHRLRSLVALAGTWHEATRIAAGTDLVQPRTRTATYRASLRDLVESRLPGRSLANLLSLQADWQQLPVRVELAGILDTVNAAALARRVRGYLRREGGELVLGLDRLQAIEGIALERLLEGVRRYQGRVSLVFEEGRERFREALAGLPHELAGLVVEGAG